MDIPCDAEMQVATVNKIRKTQNSEKEVGVLRALAILEYLALDNAREQILKNEDVLSVHDQDVSEIGETDEIRELFRAISENVPKSEMKRKLSICWEFREAWGGRSRRMEYRI